MVNPLGRTIGVNLPIYPLKGNVVTVPLKVIYNVISAMGSIRDHPFKTSACLRGGGVSPWADGQKVTVHKDQKSPS